MKFLGRLKYFGIGLGMGLVVVFAIFGTRGCDWTPTNRVKSAMQACALAANAQNQCLMECNGVTNETIYDLIYNGKVNFKDSKTKVEPKNYILYNDDYKIGFDLNLDDSTAVLTDFYFNKNTCDCAEGADKLYSINTPQSIVFDDLIKNKIIISEKNTCEMECLNLSEKDVYSIFADGDIDYALSMPNQRPNPRFAIKKSFNGKDYIFAIEKGYNTRINTIKEIGVEKECGC